MITFAHYVTQREYNRDMNKSNTSPEWTRTLTLNEPEETALVTMAKFFIDNGWIDDDNQEAFDTLVDKICEPSPFDYEVH